MGDRSNVVVYDEYDRGPLYLYTHWRGSELPEILAGALDRGRERWRDAPYLTRIIFCDMIQGAERDLTGFGISVSPTDGKEILLRFIDQTVTYRGEKFSFEEFIRRFLQKGEQP